jgi:hypothetical protein
MTEDTYDGGAPTGGIGQRIKAAVADKVDNVKGYGDELKNNDMTRRQFIKRASFGLLSALTSGGAIGAALSSKDTPDQKGAAIKTIPGAKETSTAEAMAAQQTAEVKPTAVPSTPTELPAMAPERPKIKTYEKREWPHDSEKQYVFGKLEIPKSDTGIELQIDMVFVDEENNIAIVPEVLPDGTVHADKHVPFQVSMNLKGVRQYENHLDGYDQFRYKDHPDWRTADLSGPSPKKEPGRRILEITEHAGKGFDGQPLEGQALSLFNDFKVDPETNSLVKMSYDESEAKRAKYGNAYMRMRWTDPKSNQQMEQLAISSMHRITDIGKEKSRAMNGDKEAPLTDWIDDPRGKIPNKFDDFGRNSVITFCQRALTDNRSSSDSHWPETGVIFNTAIDDATAEAEIIRQKFAEAAIKTVSASS